MCVCVCVAAIERAMAYLDTGELPWDMDIFNQVHTVVMCTRSLVFSLELPGGSSLTLSGSRRSFVIIV